MRIISVRQIKPIQLDEGGFKFPMGLHTRIELDKKSKASKKLHTLSYQFDLRHYGNIGDCCEYLSNEQLFELEEKGMIEIKRSK